MAKSAKKSVSDPVTLRGQLADALFTRAVTDGWRKLTMKSIAEEAGVNLQDALGVSTSPIDLLGHAIRRTDKAALAEIAGFGDDDSVRDRLFALLMARLDAMTSHRAGIRAIMRDGMADPALHLLIATQGLCSMSRMLEAAGLSASGPIGLARAKGLALVNANAVRVWLRDDSEDLAKTMAALDKSLARAESLALTLDPKARRRARSSEPAPDSD